MIASSAPRKVFRSLANMHRYIAFLRGINLGKRRLAMSKLKALFEEIGFANVATFIASGNVIFESKIAEAGKLERKIEQHLKRSLGYEVDTFVRSATKLAAVVALDPFPKLSKDNANVHVAFLKDALPNTLAKKFVACGNNDDAFAVKGREYYWLRRGRMTDSKIWESPELKALKIPAGTMRNMTTVRKLVEKLGIDAT
jgi:uncharacterized protein (DUF1697 family)